MNKKRIISYILILVLVFGCFSTQSKTVVEAAGESYATLQISSTKYTPTESQENRRADKGSMCTLIKGGDTKMYCILTMMKEKKDINKNTVNLNSGTIEFKKLDYWDYAKRGDSVDFKSRYALIKKCNLYMEDWYVYKLDKKNFSLLILVQANDGMIFDAEYDLNNLFKMYNTPPENRYGSDFESGFDSLKSSSDSQSIEYPQNAFTGEGKERNLKNPYITSSEKNMSKKISSDNQGIYADVFLSFKPVILDLLTINFSAKASFSATITNVLANPNCVDDGKATVVKKYVTKANETVTLPLGRNKNAHKSRVKTTTFENCTKGGKIVDKCTACGETMFLDILPSRSHEWGTGVITKQPTCEEFGERTYKCTYSYGGHQCNGTKTEKIKPFGHKYGEWKTTKEPTCVLTGLQERTCQTCGKIDKRIIGAKRHISDYSAIIIKAPTCEEDGIKAAHCINCGFAMDKKTIPATGHMYNAGVVVKAATTKETGLKKYTCDICGKTKTVTIPKLNPGSTSSNNSNNSNNTNNNTNNTNNSNSNASATTTSDGFTYTDKMSVNDIKNNMRVVDKVSGGKYKITKVTKKKGQITGGTVAYVAPYNKNCTKMTAPKYVRIDGIKFKVTQISSKAFKGCKNLRSVTIESNVHTIGKSAFYECSKLRTVNIRSTKIRKIGKNAFKGISSKAKVKVPKTKVKTYSKKLKKAGLPKTAKVTN